MVVIALYDAHEQKPIADKEQNPHHFSLRQIEMNNLKALSGSRHSATVKTPTMTTAIKTVLTSTKLFPILFPMTLLIKAPPCKVR